MVSPESIQREPLQIIGGFGEGSGPLGVGPDLSSVVSLIREGLGSIKTGYRPARSSFLQKGPPRLLFKPARMI
jgi:hypothetical protein